MKPFIHSLFVGQPKVMRDERGEWTSSILRGRVKGPIEVCIGGLNGDRVTQPYHGGPGAAVCVHLCDHYDFWKEHYGLALKPGAVGENFTVAGLRETHVCVGDVVRVGSALLQVSGPRVPCANLARRIGRGDWIKLTIVENRTGFYLRVLHPGLVSEGDLWCLEERRNENGTITAINHCMYRNFDHAAAREITEMVGLEEWWKKQFLEKLSPEKLSKDGHWTDAMAV